MKFFERKKGKKKQDNEFPVAWSKGGFSRGTKVELDSIILLFISGTASVDTQGKTAHAGDFHAQAMHTYKNIVSLLERENAGLKDVVKFTVVSIPLLCLKSKKQISNNNIRIISHIWRYLFAKG